MKKTQIKSIEKLTKSIEDKIGKLGDIEDEEIDSLFANIVTSCELIRHELEKHKPEGKQFVPYTAKGMGAFPKDMLRYDLMKPATRRDKYLIERSQKPGFEDIVHTVNVLMEWAGREPTYRRWNSFGYRVSRG
jgi:hypothetical protein